MLREFKELAYRLDLVRLLQVVDWPKPGAASPAATPAATPAGSSGGHRETFDYFWKLPVSSPEWQRETGFFLDIIARIARYCQSNRLPLTVASYPHRPQLQADPGGPLWNREVEKRVAELCNRMQVPYFSAYDGIAAAFQRDNTIYWRDDMHFTPTGQRIWADLVAAYWMDRESKERPQ